MSYHVSTTFRYWTLGRLQFTWHRYRCVYDDLRHWHVRLDWVTTQRRTALVGWTSPRCEHA